jgi:hypothetical protein
MATSTGSDGQTDQINFEQIFLSYCTCKLVDLWLLMTTSTYLCLFEQQSANILTVKEVDMDNVHPANRCCSLNLSMNEGTYF